MNFKFYLPHVDFVYFYAETLKCLVWKMNGGSDRGTICQRRPYNRVDYGIWFTVAPGGVRGYKSL